MTTTRQYTARLRQVVLRVGMKMGADLTGTSKTTRVVILACLVPVAVLTKVLVDKGIVTDAELNAAFAGAEADDQDDEPQLP